MMQVIKDFPPNIVDIRKRFELAGFHPVFTYGDKLYNPGGLDIPDDLMAHEETHERQQKEYGSVQGWWNRYLQDDGFRLNQEVEAYKEQYKYAKTYYTREMKRFVLSEASKNLASKLYGKIINKREAQELIKNYV